MDTLEVNSFSREIDWAGPHQLLFLNPRWPAPDFMALVEMARKALQENEIEPSLWLASSGSSQSQGSPLVLKVISKRNFLAAAKSFNQFFHLTQEDRWLRVLPLFHVGGLAQHARAFLAGGEVEELEDFQWDLKVFMKNLSTKSIHRVSLVPTQVYDLVRQEVRAPKSLRSVFVGGAALDDQTHRQALSLGWPLLRSYGMTETSSMVACESTPQMTSQAPMELLPGVQFEISRSQNISISAPGLLSYEVSLSPSASGSIMQLKDYRSSEKMATEDLGSFDGKYFRYLGRQSERVKVGGELVSLHRLRLLWQELNTHSPGIIEQAVLMALPHPRLECEIALVHLNSLEDLSDVVEKFNSRVLPFERIRRREVVNKIPRTALGKIQWEVLKESVLAQTLATEMVQ